MSLTITDLIPGNSGQADQRANCIAWFNMRRAWCGLVNDLYILILHSNIRLEVFDLTLMQLSQSKKEKKTRKEQKKAPEMTGGVSLSIYTETLGLQVRPIFR